MNLDYIKSSLEVISLEKDRLLDNVAYQNRILNIVKHEIESNKTTLEALDLAISFHKEKISEFNKKERENNGKGRKAQSKEKECTP